MVGDNTQESGGMNPLAYAGIKAGSDILSNLASRIFGSGDRKRLQQFIEWLRSQMGRDVLSKGQQGQMLQRTMQAQLPQQQRYAELVNKRLGLDSGIAQGELMGLQNQFANTAGLDIQKLALQLKTQRDSELLNQVGAGYRSLAG